MRSGLRTRTGLALPAILLALSTCAQEAPPAPPPWLLVPVVEAGPEIGIGGGIQFMHRNLFGGREFLRILAETSSEGQEWYEAEFANDELRDGPYATRAHILRRIVPNRRFFGLGGRTQERDETDHSLNWRSVSLRVDRHVTGSSSVWSAMTYRDVRIGAGAVRRISETRSRYPDLPGIEGGHILAATFGATYDRVARHRNAAGYEIYPEGGHRVEGSVEIAGLDTSSFQKTQYHAEAVAYRTVVRQGNILCARVAVDSVQTEHPAFWDMPALGGNDTLRGYIDRRFVGNDLLIANAEFRFPISERDVNRIVQGLHAAIFADAGRVWDQHETLALDHIASDAGVGLRLLLRPGAIARLDYGISNEASVAWFVYELPF